MSGPHDCADHWRHVPLAEGDDVLVRQCVICHRVEYESDGGRPMAWFYEPGYGEHPDGTPGDFRYAYQPAVHNHPDAPRIWRAPPVLGDPPA